jgi:hypothetical protein
LKNRGKYKERFAVELIRLQQKEYEHTYCDGHIIIVKLSDFVYYLF